MVDDQVIITMFETLYFNAISNFYRLQGYGRHSEQEVVEIGKDDLKSINDFIGNKKFLMGDKPCNTDAAVFGMVAQFIYHDNGDLNKFVTS